MVSDVNDDSMIRIITDYRDMKYDSEINCASLHEASKVNYF